MVAEHLFVRRLLLSVGMLFVGREDVVANVPRQVSRESGRHQRAREEMPAVMLAVRNGAKNQQKGPAESHHNRTVKLKQEGDALVWGEFGTCLCLGEKRVPLGQYDPTQQQLVDREAPKQPRPRSWLHKAARATTGYC